MRWRFTISRDGVDTVPIPAIETWSHDPLGYPAHFPWQDVGTANPNVPSFSGATGVSPKASDFLYFDYNFIAGWVYTIEVTATLVNFSMFPQNPRTFAMVVFSLGNVEQASATHALGAGTGTYSLTFTATEASQRFGIRFNSGSNRSITVNSTDNEITPVEDNLLVINEPDGWDGAQLKLARDKVYKSLIEFFEGTFLFYGTNGEVDGGYDTILRWEQQGGPDATIYILIEFEPYDDAEWVTLFDGQFDLSLLTDAMNRTLRLPIIRDDFWAKFMNRKATPVPLRAEVDLDGAAVTPLDAAILRLPSQEIRKQYHGYLQNPVNMLDSLYDWTVGNYVSLDVDTDLIDELSINHAGSDVVPGRSILLVAQDNGEYNPQIRIESWARDIGGVTTIPSQPYVLWYVQKNSEAAIPFTAVDHGTPTYESTVYTLNTVINLLKGDILYLYGEIIADISSIGGTPSYFIVSLATDVTPSGVGGDSGNYPTYINIIAETTFPETTAETMLVHDAAAAILKSYGLGVERPFYSEVFGSLQTTARAYPNQGCYWDHALLKGLQAKTYTMDEKPNHMSFDNWWSGIYPIFNVGLSYEYVSAQGTDGGEVIEWCPEEQPALGDFVVLNSSSEAALEWGLNPGDPITLLDCDIPVGGIPINGVSDIIKFPTDVVFEVGRLHTYNLEVSSTFSFSTEDLQIEVVQLNASDLVIGTHASYGTTAASISDTFDITINSGTVRLGIRVRFPTGTSNNGLVSIDNFEDVTECVDETEGQELIQNGDFEDGDMSWVQEGSGDPWTIAAGEATINLFTGGSSALLTQYLENTGPGVYAYSFDYTASNISIGPDSINLIIEFFDADGVSIWSSLTYISGDTTNINSDSFTAGVAVAAVRISAEMNTGDDIIIVIDNLSVTGPRIFEAGWAIRVEPVEEFYDENFEVILSGIGNNIERTYDKEHLFKKITIGYTEWQSEDIRGIDDPQTSHVYATPFKKVGEEIELRSTFVAASLALEATRRRSTKKTEDYKFDDKDFIVALGAYDEEASEFSPELDENFAAVNNLLNSDTRYNLALTPSRNMLRFIPWFNGGLDSYVGGVYRFTSGEGNYDFESQMIESSPDCGDDYNGILLGENDNLTIGSDIVHTAHYYTISRYPLSCEDYLLIRERRKKAIGISQTNENHVALFIDELTFFPARGEANITGWTKVRLDLQVLESETPTQDCTAEEAVDTSCPGGITDEFAEIITDEFLECIYV